MGQVAEATLADGSKLRYTVVDDPPRGGVKHTYFTPDKARVVQFFNDPDDGKDPNRHERIKAIIGRYNPTRPESEGGAQGNTEQTAAYFSRSFCWPEAIVTSPEFGIVCPAYPPSLFFSPEDFLSSGLKGEKQSQWFISEKLRRYLKPQALGDFRSMLQISIGLARAVRRMHQAGLAHSDLSPKNVLCDPRTGNCIIIDIDSLVVPGLFPPDVLGTPGYIAPEVLETQGLDASRRVFPSIQTDLHALAVLIYQYLLLRHPLRGPKNWSSDPDEDERLMMGSKALFIEDPNDRSNRPRDLRVTIRDLGPGLERLFLRAFSRGLHHPHERPTALEWEKALVHTWDLLHPCEDKQCAAGWFVLHDPASAVCPFCKTGARRHGIARLRMSQPRRGSPGQWIRVGELDLYDGLPLFPWHVRSSCFPDEKAERGMLGYVRYANGRWVLVNKGIQGMVSPEGRLVPSDHPLVLRDGEIFRISGADDGYLIEVSCPGGKTVRSRKGP